MHPKIDKILNGYLSSFSILLYISGLVYFCLLSDHNFNGKTYFSENALLAGLVDETFNDDHMAEYLHDKIVKFTKNNSVATGHLQQFLEQEMITYGLDVATQNFTLRYPLMMGQDQRAVGQNVYGIVRAPRAARTEAVLISVSLRLHPDRYSKSEFSDEPDEGTAAGVALMLSIARFARTQSYWSKDLIFLFTEMEVTGMQAFLDAYHGLQTSDFLTPGDLRIRSGSLQAGFTILMQDPTFRSIDLKLQGVNGLLPNMDLVNLITRMCDKYGVPVKLHGLQSPRNQHTPAAAKRALTTLFRFMVTQASCTPTGLSGLLISYQVPAVTIRAEPLPPKSRDHSYGLFVSGRVVEGILRSVNNLLERFHQSFFFYLMPRTDRYISIGIYMPPLGVTAGAPLLMAMLHLWYCKERHRPAQFFHLLPPLMLIIASTAAAVIAPTYFIGMAGVFGVDLAWGFFMGVVALQFAACCYPLLLRRKNSSWFDGDKLDWRLLKCCAVAGLLLSIGCTGVLNISLAIFASIGILPGAILVRPISNKLGRYIVRLLLLLGAPVSIAFIVSLCAMSDLLQWPPSIAPVKAAMALSNGLLQVAVEQDLIGSYGYKMVAYTFWPAWMLLWGISWMRPASPTLEADAAKSESAKKSD